MLCTNNIFKTIDIFGNIDNNSVGKIETFGNTKLKRLEFTAEYLNFGQEMILKQYLGN